MLVADLRIVSDPLCIDTVAVHQFMTAAYWTRDRTLEQTEVCLANSFPFCAFSGDKQIGFGRVISDRLALAYMLDVFVTPDYRGLGVGTKLIETMLWHADFRGAKRWMLRADEAQSLYIRFGFSLVTEGDTLMVLDRSSSSPSES